MIQLIAYNQSSDSPTYLDIDEDEDISLNFAVSEVKDFSTRKSSRSDSFSLPFTDTNNQFFNHLYNVNLATGDFDIYQRTNCEIRVDSLPQIKGYLYVNSINLTTERYEVTIIGEVGNLKDELGEKKLRDLDNDWMSSFTHAFTKTNIVNSWDFNITYVGTPQDQSGIVYPFINYGIDNRIWTIGGSNDIQTTRGAINDYEFKPAFRVKTLFERILAEAGYSYDSNFLDNNNFEFDRIYMNLASEFDITRFRVPNYYFSGYLSANQQIITPKNTSQKINFDQETSDDENLFNTTTAIFTAPQLGSYIFRFLTAVSYTKSLGETAALWRHSILFNGVETFSRALNTIATTGTDQQDSNVKIFLDAGDTLQFNVTAYDSVTENALVDFEVLSGQRVSFVELISQPNPIFGLNVNLIDNLPQLNQLDFIKSIFEHFNMFVEPKQDNPTELLIEPYPDYMDRGTTLDWTDKLDLNKEVQIIPTTDFRNNLIDFKWKEGKHYLAMYAQDFRAVNYGAYYLKDESDLSEGEFTLETKFVEPTGRLIPTAASTNIVPINLLDLSGRDKDGNPVPAKQAPTIFYFKKIKLQDDYYIQGNSVNEGTTAYNDYPYAGHYSDIPVTTKVYDLNFSNQSPNYNKTFFTNLDTQLNPFIQYWQPYFNEIYSSEARLLVGNFYLTPIDIHNLRFNNKIFVKDCFYRINKITNYKPNSQEPCRVELIKLFNASVGLANICEGNIKQFNLDGTIDFIDGEGADVNPNRKCCEGLGYTYVEGEPPKCYWRIITGDNGDPFLPPSLEGGGE